MQKDLDFISGRFFDFYVPKEKQFLFKYFNNDLQMAFLRYYMVFGNFKNFTDHTGYYCSERLLYRFQARYKKLVKLHDEAKKSLSEEGMKTLQLIESGKLPMTRLGED